MESAGESVDALCFIAETAIKPGDVVIRTPTYVEIMKTYFAQRAQAAERILNDPSASPTLREKSEACLAHHEARSWSPERPILVERF